MCGPRRLPVLIKINVGRHGVAVGLRAAVLVELRRPLADERDAQPARAAQADQIVGGMEHAARLRIRSPCLVGLVDHQIERAAMMRTGRVGYRRTA
jgi:hypothetical protein